MEHFTPEQFTDFLSKIETLKSVPRHCMTAAGVQESVAAHSWRVSLMAYLLKDELGDIDTDKVIRMCLIHDLGEAVTGDIPTFEKTSEHESAEDQALDKLLTSLPEPLYAELKDLLTEMKALQTKEAIVYKALDKLEAVIQHHESDISTWLPLEYDLQKTYAAQIVKGYPFLEGLQEIAVAKTNEKIAAATAAEPASKPSDESSAGQVSSQTAKAAAKQEKKQQKAQAKQEARTAHKAKRSAVWQERRKELSILTHLFTLVMLFSFVILAIDQVGVYGFLGVWLFIALMAASVAVLIAGVIRVSKQKRGGILITVSVAGILLCAAWFIYLFFAQGSGIGPLPN